MKKEKDIFDTKKNFWVVNIPHIKYGYSFLVYMIADDENEVTEKLKRNPDLFQDTEDINNFNVVQATEYDYNGLEDSLVSLEPPIENTVFHINAQMEKLRQETFDAITRILEENNLDEIDLQDEPVPIIIHSGSKKETCNIMKITYDDGLLLLIDENNVHHLLQDTVDMETLMLLRILSSMNL